MTTTFNPEMNDHSVLTPDQLAVVSGGCLPALFAVGFAVGFVAAAYVDAMPDGPTRGQVWNSFVTASGVPGVPH